MTNTGSPDLGGALRRAMEAMQSWRPEPEQYLVHPREMTWIKDPTGPPPTPWAVNVALGTGAIDRDHPAARALMARFGLGHTAAYHDPGGADGHPGH